MEFAPKPTKKIEQKEEVKNLEGIDFVFSENPELKKIALGSIEPSFDDKKKIFRMLRGTLIDSVRNTPEYEKYNGKTLAVDNFSEESFELLLQGLEENNIDIKPQLDNLNKTLEEQISQEVIPTGADVMDYFNPSTGMFLAFTSEQEKENSLQNTKHSLELLNYLETKDEKAREVYKNYLETIFPESKFQDLVAHETNGDWYKTENFEPSKIGDTDHGYYGKGFYFSTNNFLPTTVNQGFYGKDTFLSKLNIKNPKFNIEVDTVEKKILLGLDKDESRNIASDWLNESIKRFSIVLDSENLNLDKEDRIEYTKTLNIRLKEKENLEEIVDELYTYDSFIPENDNLKEVNYTEIMVRDTEQIHILGSEKDQGMFKEFIENKKTL